MKKVMMMTACLMLAGVLGAEPSARITEGTVDIKRGETNVVSGLYLKTGGGGLYGAGLLDSVFCTVTDGAVTNGVIRFKAYDGGVPQDLFSVTGLVAGASFRTNVADLGVYTGRVRVYIEQDAVTNATCRWAWGVILR